MHAFTIQFIANCFSRRLMLYILFEIVSQLFWDHKKSCFLFLAILELLAAKTALGEQQGAKEVIRIKNEVYLVVLSFARERKKHFVTWIIESPGFRKESQYFIDL